MGFVPNWMNQLQVPRAKIDLFMAVDYILSAKVYLKECFWHNVAQFFENYIFSNIINVMKIHLIYRVSDSNL